MFRFAPISYRDVRLLDGFWSDRQAINGSQALQKQYEQCQSTGRFDALLLKWQPGEPNQPHQFWDSDTAKWLEGACYVYASTKDDDLLCKINLATDLLIGAQQADGYLNSYFTNVCPDRRWKELQEGHELYCAGHIFEAGVAHFEATGDDRLLQACVRYADYIDSVFGLAGEKIPGYCGHPEIELALVRLYHATGTRRYLDLAAYFVNQRGAKPLWFEQENGGQPIDAAYYLCHAPVWEQKEARGHAVRAMYLYSAMADLARELGDTSLWDAVSVLWNNVTGSKMYVTGGVGSSWAGESFGPSYDLPNERAYCETCAAVGLFLWAHRMLQKDGDARFAAVMERALHNGILSGMSLDGRKFFYQNPLASHGGHHRREWFGCACCPSNLSRLLASLGGYLYSHGGDALSVHQYINSEVVFAFPGGLRGTLRQHGGCPWEGQVRINLELSGEREWELRLRLPEWTNAWAIRINGREEHPLEERGYLCVRRAWRDGDSLELMMPMPIRRTVSHPKVIGNAGHGALERGPFVYCIEDTDFDRSVAEIALSPEAPLSARLDPGIFPIPMVILEGQCSARPSPSRESLYERRAEGPKGLPFRAVPVFAWDNRSPGAMRVWIPFQG